MKEKLFITDFLVIDFPELEGSPDLVYRAKQLRDEYVIIHMGRFEEFENKTEEQLEKMDLSMTEMEVLYTTQAAGLIRVLKGEVNTYDGC